MKSTFIKGSRSRVLALAILLIAAIFIGRLFYLQVVQHDYYVALAAEEQQSRFVIPANRGTIYAKSGSTPVELVMNQTVYTVFADPQTVQNKEEIVKSLKEIAGGNTRPNLEALLAKKESRYQILATKLTRLQADKLKEKDFYGIGFQETSQRVYPEGSLAAHVLGFVNTEGVGTYGIEAALNDELNGKDGVLQAVTDVRNVPLTVGNNNIRIPKQDGKNIVLSIDRTIQSKVEQALLSGVERTGASNVSAVVLNPKNGEVMALANLPTYSPGEYFKAEDVAVFNNNVISAPYEPGSTIKAFTMAAAVDKNVAKPTDTYVNTDSIQVEDRTITNAVEGKTGTITFQTAMQWSLNTGFVTLAQRLGNGSDITPAARNTIYDYFYHKFRLGQKTGIELASEAAGTVISPDQPTGNAVRYSNMSFGQGMEATMLQVAASYGALINGGNYYTPTLIDGYIIDDKYVENNQPEPAAKAIIKPSTSAEIRDMLVNARLSGFPEADRSGYSVGGKTGTSQVIKNGQYSTTETIASYVGFGGVDEPEYVIMVQVSGKDREFQGARDAMPIFTEISNWMIEYLKLQPKG
jgi:cell division protein FtsI (penicillin-binding protein 3)